MNLQILILAGGLGTRLKSVVHDLPKSLAPVRGTPFLFYILDYIQKQQITNSITLSVGYKAEMIINSIGYKFRNIAIDYCIEEEPLGTGGAIKNCLSHRQDFDDCLILNGDTYAEIDIVQFLQFHKNQNSEISIASKRMFNFDRYGYLEVDSNSTVIKFHEKKMIDTGLINCGSYLITKKFYLDVLKKFGSQKFSFEKDILERKNGYYQVKTFSSDFYFLDIGIPEDYSKAQNEFKEIK